eukprot:1157084-Pelagomonas_calceolata.AAC.2
MEWSSHGMYALACLKPLTGVADNQRARRHELWKTTGKIQVPVSAWQEEHWQNPSACVCMPSTINRKSTGGLLAVLETQKNERRVLLTSQVILGHEPAGREAQAPSAGNALCQFG